MGYRKVYLTLSEEEDIKRIKEWREDRGDEGAAYNAILKEGLAAVMDKELALRNKGVVVGTTEKVVGADNQSSHITGRRRRRRA